MSKDFALTPELYFLCHLSQKYKDEENLDAEVHVDENVFKASKFLLCIGSPVIKAAFAHNTERPNTLIIDNFEVKIVEQFLLFLHTGNLTLDYQNFDLLLLIADFFDVVPLQAVCVKSMDDNLNADNAMKYYAVADKFNVCGLKMNASKVFQKSITIKNFHDRYKFAISNGYAEFEEILVDFMKINVDQLCLSSAWNQLDIELKQKLLKFQQMQNMEQSGINLKPLNCVPANLTGHRFLTFVLIGMHGVDCTNIIKRFLFKKVDEQISKDEFLEAYKGTYTLNNEKLLIHFFGIDINSLYRYKNIIKAEFTGVFLIYDIGNVSSYMEAIECLKQIRKFEKQSTIMLVGNKCDSSRPRQIQTEDAHDFAKRNKLLFTEILTLDSKNVHLALETMISEKLKHSNVEDDKNCSIM